MRKLFLSLFLLAGHCGFAQIANHVVISEIYGGGGNTGSVWRNDFIELYNPTDCPVSVNGWSVQYASATGSSWQVTALTGTIPAKGFYLVQEAQGTGGTVNLPSPDATGTIAMSGTAGKVALVNTTTALSGACPTGAMIIDFVGFGATAGCFEGAGATPAPSNTTSIERKASATSTAATLAAGGSEVAAGNGYDAGVNSTDFVAQTLANINPQNSAVTEGTTSVAVSAVAGISPAEPSTDGTFTVQLTTAAPVGGITVTYTLTGTANAGVDYTDVQAGTVTIPQGGTTATVDIDILDDMLSEGNETIILTLQSASGGFALCGAAVTHIISDNDASTTALHTIQGTGGTATAGTYVSEAIVTGVFPLLSPAGFYIQEEDADADTDSTTSEAIFVVSGATVAVGDRVRVEGTVQENSSSPSFGHAVFTSATVTVLSNNNPLPTIKDIAFPFASMADPEFYEGMLVRFPATLTVTNNYTLGRFGEVGLSAGGDVYQPTQLVDPNDDPAAGTTSTGTSNVAAVTALANSNALRTILLDDGRNTIPTLPYVDPVDNTLRTGSTITNLTGIMGYAFNVYRIQPIPSAPPVFNYAPRPTGVPSVGTHNVKVASFNVLNYFNGNGTGGGFPTSRGAHTLAEFIRQRDKIISAISQIDADVVGLIEIENDGTSANSAIQDLVNGLNAVMGAGTYSIINDGATVQANNTDEIRCGIIYKPSMVTPVGAAMLGANAVFNRPPLAQTFALVSNDVEFNFIINHFKSKSCTGSTGANLDLGDGQSCYNSQRKQQATELINFINTTVITTSGTDRVLSMGDYNAYYEEDPMDILRAANYTVLGSATEYSYQFSGQLGTLDHAIASNTLNPYVTGSEVWNINAAEPTHLDYNDLPNDGGSDFANPWAGTYTVSPFRSSDHDPVIVGLNLPSILPVSLVDFTAAKREGASQLAWKAVEDKVQRYIVERSADGKEWANITTKTASGQEGSIVSYAAMDNQPLDGNNLYRLKIEFVDGKNEYSATRLINFQSLETVQIYPNPASKELNVILPADESNTTLQVYNITGQLVAAQQANGSQVVSMDVTALPVGMYTIKLVNAHKATRFYKFIKE